MLKTKGHVLPHVWIAGDDEMGRPAWFRRELGRLGERYLLAVQTAPENWMPWNYRQTLDHVAAAPAAAP